MRVVIIDGYVDEPACFGVPPYISPYIRYIAGALVERRVKDIHYLTIDSLRQGSEKEIKLLNSADLVVIISGITVPGKYLRSTPITPGEINNVCDLSDGLKVIGGPIRLGFSKEGGMSADGLDIFRDDVVLARKDIEAYIFDLIDDSGNLCRDDVSHRMRSVEEIGRWAPSGAFIIRQHPDYPHLMCELETYRGCGRRGHCSFCTESFYGTSVYRPVEDVIAEVVALYEHGAVNFRLGRQPDLLNYHSVDVGEDVRKPQPEVLESLYSAIRKVAPQLHVLHMDNANPGTIAAYPDESREILRTIVKYHTSGDVAALGMESADPEVVRKNGLKAMPEDVFGAIELINEVGAVRGSSGLPELLPGLNFVHGLPGETKKTFGLNYAFLKRVLDSNLLVRRINIRQVMAFPETPVYGRDQLVWKNKKLFLKYKDRVRKEIDHPMLLKLVPGGTILTDVMPEVYADNKSGDVLTFGRQFGSYPLLIGIPEKVPPGEMLDVKVVGHGQRSITAVPYRTSV